MWLALLLQALDPDAVTVDAASQNHENAIKGSIEVGKLADFVVLGENPLAVHPEHIRNIRVLATIEGGEKVFDSRRAR